MKLSVKKTTSGGSLRLYNRYVDSTHKVYVDVSDSTLAIKQQDSSSTTLVSASVTTTTNTWYDYHVISDGDTVEIWRGPQGGTTELLLQTDGATVLGTANVYLESRSATAHYDNVQFIANDPTTTTFAYDNANELNTMTTSGVTTTFTYDDWGRTISKDDGTHSATYTWRFGDKLKDYESDFPGEADVAFQYDGLGKRRLKLTSLSATPPDSAYTWYRWDAGWNMIGEYSAGTETGTTWDVGALTRWYAILPGSQRGTVLAHIDGDPDSSAYNYYLHDLLGTPRTTCNQSQATLARQELLPYGAITVTAGLSVDIGFTGHKWEEELHSFYTAFRHYSPISMRWGIRDSFGIAGGLNLYNYTTQPGTVVDLLGLFCIYLGQTKRFVSKTPTGRIVKGVGLEIHGTGDVSCVWNLWEKFKYTWRLKDRFVCCQSEDECMNSFRCKVIEYDAGEITIEKEESIRTIVTHGRANPVVGMIYCPDPETGVLVPIPWEPPGL